MEVQNSRHSSRNLHRLKSQLVSSTVNHLGPQTSVVFFEKRETSVGGGGCDAYLLRFSNAIMLTLDLSHMIDNRNLTCPRLTKTRLRLESLKFQSILLCLHYILHRLEVRGFYHLPRQPPNCTLIGTKLGPETRYSCIINCPKDKNLALTKRGLLSLAQSIFDSLGTSTPVTIIPKFMLQESWNIGLEGDDALPEGLSKQFWSWLKGTKNLSEIKLPRWMKLSEGKEETASLHVFCDASAKATCIFLRVEINLIWLKNNSETDYPYVAQQLISSAAEIAAGA
ncbi:hypothetical protein HNY73_010275 [Argiope bruennichi]|uniref:Uncharacterized protein n=1 Tax=Argiope bruennichi TaxID=94029 RepID=A0A8T0F0G2_ARGBR|nr:hypothetical protein HNY73_010275 [Argiope bruennichi]